MRRGFLYGLVAYGLVTAGLVAAATSTPTAQSGVQTLTAVLTGGNEAPSVVNTGAYGFATVTINPGTGEVTWVIDVFNFPTGLTASHIHAGAAGTPGPVIIDFNPQPIGVSGPFRLSGSSTTVIPRPAAGVRTMQEAMVAIAAGNTYVNVHSQLNPGGEIRGQLCPAKASDNTFNGINTCFPQPSQQQ
jgi:hypothetical protein